MADYMRQTHHDPTNYGSVPAPHGPENGDDHASYPSVRNAENEKAIFAYLLQPDDLYTPEGTYWADLPISKRISFVNKVNNAEAAKELRAIGSMVKRDPLSPIGWYFRNAVLPGAGLGLEGYVLFSIGNLSPLFTFVWPRCWQTDPTKNPNPICNKQWVYAVQYLEVIGIIVGQVLVGLLGDGLGRRYGLLQDALIMLLGLVMLTAAWGVDLNGWVICYAWSLFIYGVGVGGEYPMTATAAMENATGSGRVSTKADRLHRGRNVTTAFLMQGWGQFFNQVILILCLLIFHSGKGNGPYSELATQWTYRVSFAIPAAGTLWLCYYRWYKMPLASKTLQMAKNKSGVTGYDVTSLKLTVSQFGGRLVATAGAWFCNDVFFYGNKLFQGQFISVLSPTANSRGVMTNWLWNLVNIGCALVGYYLASFLVDNKLYGRKWMQQIGFLLCFVLFVVPAFHYEYYTSSSHPDHVHAFQAMYFLSSFFNQFGPNSVTFLVAAEVYPTPIRASAHGVSAAVGKLGALMTAVLGNYITTKQKFMVVPWFGLAGMIITFLWLPDTTGLDLKEQERRWHYIRQGRGHEYHGIAVHPHHLSVWERLRGIGKQYNPELDYQMKIDDMRSDWEAKQQQKSVNENGLADEEDEYSDEIHQYFTHSTRNTPMLAPMAEKKLSGSDSDMTPNEKRTP